MAARASAPSRSGRWRSSAILLARRYRGGRVFRRGLAFLADYLTETHPEVREMRFAALANNAYLCRRYGKFARERGRRDGTIGPDIGNGGGWHGRESPAAAQVQFWPGAGPSRLQRLWAKLAALPGATRTVYEGRVLYTLPLDELEMLGARYAGFLIQVYIHSVCMLK
ncbi:hypothetical protein IDH44_17435 [Paenibacillus sp. IB182496]|uniref:Uncharacterized protein n=1 Tax=Paenibacillus sabuli TaxID=2772509 RepID=A0A927BX66_9BACL|nr:hypothetical protein [Paenibacillus sabuli]MBD2846983.1 hypothetical protein [Paenibacillus sabuli]